MASITDAVGKNLGAFLKANMPSLNGVQYEFPAPNQPLQYPSVSIFQQSPSFQPMANWVLFKGSVIASGPDAGKYPVKRIIGQFNFQIQLDFWTRSKPERNKIFEEFLAAFHKDRVSGVSLQMADYHNIWIHHSLDAFTLETSDMESTKNEWRSKVNLVANCYAVAEANEYLMETIENKIELPPAIEEQQQQSGEQII